METVDIESRCIYDEVKDLTVNDIVREIRNCADRLKAAWECEAKAIATENAVLPAVCITKPVGNAAAMREAVDGIKNTASNALTALSIGNDTSSFLWDIIRKCEAALAEPLRNCDVGTAEEQDKKFNKFCYAHRSNEKGCVDCPLLINDGPCCELAWAQMPYVERVNEGESR